MYEVNDCRRIETIIEKIEAIETIIQNYRGIAQALSDTLLAKPAILMHLVAIAEQFDKLKNNNAFEILSQFDKKDLKGAYDIRNFIAHDYDGISLAIIETIIRDKLPELLKQAKVILEGCSQ